MMRPTAVRSAAVALAAFLSAFAVYWVPPQHRGWDTVPRGNDSGNYLDIAVEFAKGRGLSENADDATLRALTTSGLSAGNEADAGTPHPSTRWPPLFSMILAAAFRAWGFDLTVARALNCALMAATCALLVTLLFRRGGAGPAALFFVLFVIVDVRTRDHSRAIMTEPLACFLVTLTAIVLATMVPRRPFWGAAAAGASWGLAILARGIFVLWLPGLVLLVLWLAGSERSRSATVRVGAAAAFLATTLAITTPWFVHNSRALEAFMPLGSHMETLPSGFSEEAWARGGVWFSLGREYFAGVSDPNDPPMVVARKQALYGRSRALSWIRANPGRAALLGVRKAMMIWLPDPSVAITFLVFPALGLLALRRSTDCVVVGGFLVLNTLAVAATWTFQIDRFQVPVLGLLHYAAAIGLWWIARLVLDHHNGDHHNGDHHNGDRHTGVGPGIGPYRQVPSGT
jgi:hypothetical protein